MIASVRVLTGATALALALAAQSASAATLTFDDFITTDDNDGTPTPVVSISDTANAGFLTFSIGSTGLIGELSGVFFDVSGILVSLEDIVNESLAIIDFGNNTGDLGNGVNVNGGYTDGTKNPIFDFGLAIADADVSGTPFTFRIADSLLQLDDIEGVGLRFQSVGADGEGSAKNISYVSTTEEPPPPAPIPLPAGVVLLGSALAGLGGLSVLRRRSPTA